jgi:hypothetical protein
MEWSREANIPNLGFVEEPSPEARAAVPIKLRLQETNELAFMHTRAIEREGRTLKRRRGHTTWETSESITFLRERWCREKLTFWKAGSFMTGARDLIQYSCLKLQTESVRCQTQTELRDSRDSLLRSGSFIGENVTDVSPIRQQKSSKRQVKAHKILEEDRSWLTCRYFGFQCLTICVLRFDVQRCKMMLSQRSSFQPRRKETLIH